MGRNTDKARLTEWVMAVEAGWWDMGFPYTIVEV